MDSTLNLSRIAKHFSDETAARELLESMRWPNGPECPLCGETGTVYRMKKLATSTKPGRAGLLRCRACKKQFTVTTGTVFEDSHIPMSKWLLALHLLSSSKKGMSAHQIHRMLGVTLKSAWFIMHRLRYAMSHDVLGPKLRGVVEADETYIGPRRVPGKHGRGAGKKIPVVALVERGGKVRAFPVERVTSETLGVAMRALVDQSADLMTDELNVYRPLGRDFASHQTVSHLTGEYVRADCHVNTAEGFFSLLKRGVNGTFHHISRRHLWRYCEEFAFRYNARKVTDGERTALVVAAAEGKRLTYRPLAASDGLIG